MTAASPVTLARDGDVAVLRIENPPVNALSSAVIDGLIEALSCFERDDEARLLIVACAGRTFVAGGDIGAFDSPDFSAVPFNGFLARLEAQDRPVVAALHGMVLGGGLELALACHARVAVPSTQFGFPEVKLGLLPGSLGTQRLPRLVGARLGLDLISTGRLMMANTALEAGIVDRIVDTAVEGAIALARELIVAGKPMRRLSQSPVPVQSAPAALFEQAAAEAQTRLRAYPAAAAIVRAVQASLGPFDEGEAVEARLFEELRASRASQALRHLFFAQREARRIPGLPRELGRREVRSVGVLGAGTMGRGIAMNFLNAGLPVLLVETSGAALDAAITAIRALYEASAARGKLRAEDVQARMALLSGMLDDNALAECDLVIEAVYEDLSLKKRVCSRLGTVCKPGAIIASNTSTLDVDVLAAATGRPADVVGMHFFSPANVMKLLEVVRGGKTSPEVLATVMEVARSIGKVAVVSGVCYGFIGNRMAEVYMREAEFLLMEGASPTQVDSAVEAIGMAMGPCRMLDMAGVDVGAKTVIEYCKVGGLPPDESYRAVVRALFERGRFGQKTGSGYYRYEGRKPVADPETARIAGELASRHGIAHRDGISDQEIVERLLYSMVNEAAKILEEGIAYRGSDIDVVWTAGYGFPDYQGGPLFMADHLGLSEVIDRLDHYARACGNTFGYWTVSPLLARLAAEGGHISNWQKKA